jgi:ribonucleoside-triphosphate reductase (thioredoxin)
MSLKALSDYTFYSRYSQYLPKERRRETWEEAVKRVFDMHRKKYAIEIENSEELKADIDFAERQVIKKRVLGSQRALQYAGEPTLRRMERIYNCSGLHISKPKAFQDVVWLLLAGCGVGISVQYQDINKLPMIKKPTGSVKKYVIPDSCEGWADAIGILLSSYFVTGGMFPEYQNAIVKFDFSQIRPKGALISGQFKAPGSKPLENGIAKIVKLLNEQFENSAHSDTIQLKPIICYDIIMHCADFVVSAGLRRSALICLFSKEDTEMAESKIGDWFIKNPQRGRSNNSVIIKRDNITQEEFSNIFANIKNYGEPGWLFVEDYNQLTNPCAEIVWHIEDNDSPNSIIGFCNLTEINGRFCSTEENFLKACKAAAIIGTLQAGFTKFPYLGKETEEFVKRESLLGVSITGWMDNPEILFNSEILEKGAEAVKTTNAKIAKLININPAARTTCAKPSGHTSCLLSTASGIHPHHAKRYIRRVQSNKQEFALDVFKKVNPIAIEESVWSANKTDDVVSFLCEVPAGAILKNQLSAVELLDKVKIAQKHWVKAGINDELNIYKGLAHSVSNTITVNQNEWDEVEKYIFNNKEYFTGISLLPSSGDLDYVQAPFSTVLAPHELVKEYGDASVFASGLVVDGLHAFDNNLWKACDTVLGIGMNLDGEILEPIYPQTRNYKALSEYFSHKEEYEKYYAKKDWVRRVQQFADRYFKGDLRQTTYCLKHVSLWKTWCDLKREYKEVDWAIQTEESRELKNIDEQAAVACHGGACLI